MVMTAEMIEWTFFLLEWIREKVPEEWPEAQFRGNSAELDPDGYSIRFRQDGEEYWMAIQPEVMQGVTVKDVTDLLVAENWVEQLKRTGCLHIGTQKGKKDLPELHPCPYAA